MDFFKLAYLIEITVVLNLTYRELKLYQLNTKIIEVVDKLTEEAESKVSTDILLENQAYLALKYLIAGQDEIKKKFCVRNESLFRDKNLVFYINCIRSGIIKKIIIFNILFCISLLILITSLPFIEALIKVLFSIELIVNENFQFLLWSVCFVFLCLMCILPIWFIRRTSKTDIFLFGSKLKDKPGLIIEFEKDINTLLLLEDGNLKNQSVEAKDFSVNN